MKYYIIAGEASGDLHGINLMKELLENEGHKFSGDKLLNFKDVFWDPSESKTDIFVTLQSKKTS